MFEIAVKSTLTLRSRAALFERGLINVDVMKTVRNWMV